MTEMGFNELPSKKGLLMTANRSIEDAIAWIMDHESDPDLYLPLEKLNPQDLPFLREEPEPSQMMSSEYKVVFCVRTDINMSTGKIAAQCAHAAIGENQRTIHSQQVSGTPLFNLFQGFTKG
uniref:peptidyl-tRNA hydrolase n=1 Tax=Arcella intermedia TaxID=1963864 RepID=A0A6B2LQ80_9EUKA